jgi:hypothetical protein
MLTPCLSLLDLLQLEVAGCHVFKICNAAKVTLLMYSCQCSPHLGWCWPAAMTAESLVMTCHISMAHTGGEP